MEKNKIKELSKHLRKMVMQCDEEEILNIIKVFSDLIKVENKNIRMEFIDNISQIYLSYTDEPILQNDKEYEEYNKALIEQEKLLKQYIPKENQIDFDDKYCVPLILEHNKAYKKGLLDGLTKLSFLKNLL